MTLRNQILSVYLVVMLFVLAIVSFFVYNQVSALVKKNAENQMKQTAIEANGRMETLYNQVDTLSSELVTDKTIQQKLLSMTEGNPPDFSQRQTLARIIGNYQVYSEGIQGFELYSSGETEFTRLMILNFRTGFIPSGLNRQKSAKEEWYGLVRTLGMAIIPL